MACIDVLFLWFPAVNYFCFSSMNVTNYGNFCYLFPFSTSGCFPVSVNLPRLRQNSTDNGGLYELKTPASLLNLF